MNKEPVLTRSCCVPSAGQDRARGSGSTGPPLTTDPTAAAAARHRMVALDGGAFRMGGVAAGGYPEDGEGPVHRVSLASFQIDPHAVSNERFTAFVAATGHVSDAERYGWSFVFGGFLPDDFPPTRAVAHAPWWRQVYGACWRHPEGSHSDLEGRRDHPERHTPTDRGRVGVRRPRRRLWPALPLGLGA
jgi:sulfatase modifying factor 1